MKLQLLNIQDVIKEAEDFLLSKIPRLFQLAEMFEEQTISSELIYYKGEKILPKDELKRDK